MKAEQDIERQLADAQSAWDAAPPADLWDRLEAKLDGTGQPLPLRKPRHWPFRIVAVFLPILALGLGWWLWPTDTVPQRKARPAMASESELFIPPVPGRHSPPRNRPAHGSRIAGDHEMGSQGKSSAYHSVAESQTEFTSPGRPPHHEPDHRNTVNQYPGRTDLEQANYILPNGKLLVTNGYGNPVDTVSSLHQYFSLFHGLDNNRWLQLNPSRNDLHFNMALPANADAKEQNLQHFKWLLGSWKTFGSSGGAMEDWRQQDEFTLVGRGYFVVNRDTIVTQEMRIEQRGPNVYYIIAKDENNQAMKFRLRSRAGNELIFQDDGSRSRTELVLRNNPVTNEVEKILQTPDDRRAAQLSKSAAPAADGRQLMKRR